MSGILETVMTFVHSMGYMDYLIVAAVIIVGYLFIRQRNSSQAPGGFSSASNFKVIAPTMTTTNSGTANFIDKMKTTGRTIVVFYGSQTGTAEDFATRVSKGAASYGLKALVVDPEECDMELLTRLGEIPNSMAVFCMATYGEGDPTDNAQEFVDWLKLDEHQLPDLNYTVFALGNRTYEHFNATGIFVDKRLEELGAKRVFRLGLGDDDGNIEEDFVAWQEEMWRGACEFFGISSEAHEVLIRQYDVEFPENVDPSKLYNGEVARLGSYNNQKAPYDAKNPFLAPITVIRELHEGGDRSCMHVELDITGSRLRYDCGDHVAIFPMNQPQLVEAMGARLKTDLDTVFSLNNVDEDSSKRHPFPCPCTFRTALLYYLDLCSMPKTNVLRELAEYASDEDKSFLKRMSAPTEEARALYKEWIVDKHRNILHVLEDLPSVMPPLPLICELLPRLQARYYSISSSPKLYPNSIHVTAVLVDYATPLGRPMQGVATSWLSSKKPLLTDDVDTRPKVPIFVRRSQFRLPYKSSTPVIMVGPGTGLAPFRGFIQERLFNKREGKPVGETALFFGCRRSGEDYIYRSELESCLEEGALTTLCCAFSRDSAAKEYVQHHMKRPDNAALIWRLLEAGGHFYICGDAKNMARDVLQTLEMILQEHGAMDQAKAQEYIKRLQNKGRYSADVWS